MDANHILKVALERNSSQTIYPPSLVFLTFMGISKAHFTLNVSICEYVNDGIWAMALGTARARVMTHGAHWHGIQDIMR